MPAKPPRAVTAALPSFDEMRAALEEEGVTDCGNTENAGAKRRRQASMPSTKMNVLRST